MSDIDLLEHLKKTYGEELSGEKGPTILYGSETGNAEAVSKGF
jgi:hypothetical protein